ncbi:MAG: hypothetical protein JXR62_06515 [Bacilli bacterium]|nr:hypothetical protein [Bacilli bacterium]
MSKMLIMINVLFVLLLSSKLTKEADHSLLIDEFSIIGMPRENILDFLGFEREDYSDYPIINTVNMVTETIVIDQIIIDTEAIYYALFKTNNKVLNEKLDYHSIQAVINGDQYSYQKLRDFQSFLFLNDIENKEKIQTYLKETNQLDYNSDFFKDILSIENENIVFNLDHDNKIYQTKTIHYYEDFDLDETLSGVYKNSEIIDVDLYYIKSETCNDFNFSKKIDESELTTFINDLNQDQESIVNGCYLQLFTHTGENKIFPIFDEEYYPHKQKYVFEYQSNYTRPYLRTTVIFDYWNLEKMLIASEVSSFKITKEAHYHRNDYNCEIIDSDWENKCKAIGDIYPTKYYVNEQDFWLYSKNNYFHQLGESNKFNVKYLKIIDYYDDYANELKKGSFELIYDELGDLVVDDQIIYTFNFGVSEMDHYLKDIFPYLVWGNTMKDRSENTSYARMIWDKDRFTNSKTGSELTGIDLIHYFESKSFIQNIGSKIPTMISNNEIDNYYFTIHGQ